MEFSKPITDIIKQRFSCRTYTKTPIDETILKSLHEYCTSVSKGPFGTKSRFEVVASRPGDSEELKGLGTYGFIHNATGFIIGASEESKNHLEDFGYLMERIILFSTDLGLGTCWLGGTFTRSKFAERISPNNNEIIPAVTSIGYIGGKPRKFDQRIRKSANADQRLPETDLFFDSKGNPLTQEIADKYSSALEMVRLGPSASNKQPWRIVVDGESCHFYLQRTPGYRDNPYSERLKIADLQLVDIGIAMCHFEMTLKELNIDGSWEIIDNLKDPPRRGMEYVVSYV